MSSRLAWTRQALARWMHFGPQDLRSGQLNHFTDALRQLRRRPGLSVVIVAILAIGIGVTTGIYSLFHQVLVRPLPVPEPEQLVNVVPSPVPALSYAMFRDLETGQNVFAGFAGYDDVQVNIAYGDRPRSASVDIDCSPQGGLPHSA